MVAVAAASTVAPEHALMALLGAAESPPAPAVEPPLPLLAGAAASATRQQHRKTEPPNHAKLGFHGFLPLLLANLRVGAQSF
jgi:hypothetical protein